MVWPIMPEECYGVLSGRVNEALGPKFNSRSRQTGPIQKSATQRDGGQSLRVEIFVRLLRWRANPILPRGENRGVLPWIDPWAKGESTKWQILPLRLVVGYFRS
jgi:hypothetical protein